MDKHTHTEHSHAHATEAGGQVALWPLATALAITGFFLVAEVIGGLWTNSLALLADAGHMATDVAALALSLVAVWLARRPATPRRSFGFYRAEVLAALINAAALIVVSIFIFWEAYERLYTPPEVDSGPMLAVAVAGLAANIASAWVLTKGGGHKHNLNTRGAFLHVIGDLLGSVGAILAAVIMLLTGWYLADPILSALIGMLVLRGAWKLLSETVGVLMEMTPQHINVEEVRQAMSNIPGIAGVHDLHIWTVTSGFVALSAHVEVRGEQPWNELLAQTIETLRHDFEIQHVTLQPEQVDPHAEVVLGCSLNKAAPPHTCTALPHQRLEPHVGH